MLSIFVILSVQNQHYNGGQLPSIPGQYCLGGTPLNAAIVASHELVRRFKRDHNVQIVNTVFLTDGDSSQAGYYLDSEGKEQHIGRNDQLTVRDIPSKRLHDPKLCYLLLTERPLKCCLILCVKRLVQTSSVSFLSIVLTVIKQVTTQMITNHLRT